MKKNIFFVPILLFAILLYSLKTFTTSQYNKNIIMVSKNDEVINQIRVDKNFHTAYTSYEYDKLLPFWEKVYKDGSYYWFFKNESSIINASLDNKNMKFVQKKPILNVQQYQYCDMFQLDNNKIVFMKNINKKQNNNNANYIKFDVWDIKDNKIIKSIDSPEPIRIDKVTGSHSIFTEETLRYGIANIKGGDFILSISNTDTNKTIIYRYNYSKNEFNKIQGNYMVDISSYYSIILEDGNTLLIPVLNFQNENSNLHVCTYIVSENTIKPINDRNLGNRGFAEHDIPFYNGYDKIFYLSNSYFVSKNKITKNINQIGKFDIYTHTVYPLDRNYIIGVGKYTKGYIVATKTYKEIYLIDTNNYSYNLIGRHKIDRFYEYKNPCLGTYLWVDEKTMFVYDTNRPEFGMFIKIDLNKLISNKTQ